MFYPFKEEAKQQKTSRQIWDEQTMSIEVCKICSEKMDTDFICEIYEYGFPMCDSCTNEYETTQDFSTLIHDCGLSLRGAARLLNVTYDSIKNWHTGRSKVPHGVIIDLQRLRDYINDYFERGLLK